MRKLIVLLTLAILALGATPVLAINATFIVTGHFGVTTTTSKCTSLPYPALCPSGDNCVCYTATKTSLHTATGGLLTIPPGTTTVDVSVDNTRNTRNGHKPRRIESVGPIDDRTVEAGPFVVQRLPIGVEGNGFRDAGRRPRHRHLDQPARCCGRRRRWLASRRRRALTAPPRTRPSTLPASTSSGKCTPASSRENAISAAST